MSLGAGWLVLAGAAQAGPQFVTDDPELPPAGGWEINVPFTLERTVGKTEMNAPLFDVNYGLPNAQLKLEAPAEVVRDDHDATAAGPGDLLLGLKWRFFDDDKSQMQLALPASAGPDGRSPARPRRWPTRLRVAATGTKELDQMDALWRRRLLVANRGRQAQLLVRRRRAGA